MSGLFLGVDLGTSGLKLAAVRGDGTVAAEAEAAYEVDHPMPGHAEISPQVWVEALDDALSRLEPVAWSAVGIAGQMHGLVVLDDAGVPCRPAVLWPDRRAERDMAAWRGLPVDMRRRLANPLTAGMAGPILGWLAQHEPQVMAHARYAVQPKDYLRAHLGGEVITERSDASATLMWDVPGEGWALDVLDTLGLPTRLLPEVVPSGQVVGQARLPGDPPIVAGAGDTPAALRGSGGLAAGEVQVNLGSGAQILMGVAQPDPQPDPVTHLYADTDRSWYGMVALQNGGLALDAVRQWLQMSWGQVFDAAAGTPAGAGGVSVIPYLTGERGAVAQPTSRGAWLGLSDTTTAQDLARAAVEGMVFAVARGVEVLAGPRDRIRMTGGGARNQVVVQALADLLGARVDVLPDRSASAIGAAMLAAAGVGQSLPVAGDPPTTYEPQANPALRSAYERWRARAAAADL